jgi:hypothetical protein
MLNDIVECFDTVVVNQAMSYAKIFDAGDCSVQLSDADVLELGARVSAYAAFEPRGPIAIVLPNGRGLDIAERFFNLGSAKRPGKVFRTREQALAWLASLTG